MGLWGRQSDSLEDSVNATLDLAAEASDVMVVHDCELRMAYV